MNARTHFAARQNGAALVVGLIMLVIITLLAISGMNTATVELIMAGNEQFRQRAFQAASTGLEHAIVDLPNVPQSGPVTVPETTVLGSTTDKYTTTTQYMGDDLNIPGFSAGKFVGLHYQIVSTGTSARNSRSVQTQGAFIIQNAGNTGTFSSINP